MKRILFIISLFIPSFCSAQATFTVLPDISQAAPAEARLRGRILLQVESHGEAWYIRPQDGTRVYMKNGDAAYALMRDFGLGISNADLVKIPVGFHDYGVYDGDDDGDGIPNFTETTLGTDAHNPDSDNDSFNDKQELINGFDPLGPSKLNYDYALAHRLGGRILLQVESKGEAWYVNPNDHKRYYMKNGLVAYQMMRYMSLGISNQDLAKISYYNNSALSYDWKNYQNIKYDFSFKYPSDWNLSDWVDDKIRPEFVKVAHPHASWNFAVCPDPSETNCLQYVGASSTYTKKIATEVTIFNRKAMKTDYSFGTPCEQFGCMTTYTFIDKPEGWGEYKGWENDIDILMNWHYSEQKLILDSIFSTLELVS